MRILPFSLSSWESLNLWSRGPERATWGQRLPPTVPPAWAHSQLPSAELSPIHHFRSRESMRGCPKGPTAWSCAIRLGLQIILIVFKPQLQTRQTPPLAAKRLGTGVWGLTLTLLSPPSPAQLTEKAVHGLCDCLTK